MKTVFWISLFVVFYTFLGYGMLLYGLIRLKRLFKGKRVIPQIGLSDLPSCTLIIAAFNEEDFIREKIANTLKLNYPKGKLKLLFITDGSTDSTPDIIAQYPEIKLMHSPERKGKIVAVHRAVKEVTTEVVVFTDANTFLNADALINICRHYSDPQVGAIAGEKRIMVSETADASAAGEGFYWKYESKLKAWDSELYSVVGAAGELFSVRLDLYQPVPSNTLLDDFMISMLIAMKGYRIIYEPDAYAAENSSANVSEELKRKVRIAAGGIQSIIWLKELLAPFKFPILSFQYISHRVLRWTITPFLLLLIFILNVCIIINTREVIYTLFFVGQIAFYSAAIIGFLFERRKIRVKILYIPYYFCIMNYAVLAGIQRYFLNTQSVLWDKAKRATADE